MSSDESHLDNLYFVDNSVYNCPFCRRRHVAFSIADHGVFDWTAQRKCYYFIARCDSCERKSLHFSAKPLIQTRLHSYELLTHDIDEALFASIPSSSFTVDARIPAVLRDLITEAQQSLNMNLLTGASAAARKAIYELTVLQGVGEGQYDDRVKALKAKFPLADPTLFDTLGHIIDLTSDNLHEESWEKWNAPTVRLVLETLRAILDDIYVTPAVRAERAKKVQQLQQEVVEAAKKTNRPGRPREADAPVEQTPDSEARQS